ncbi:MAG TPA: HEAT repeat domain-containing protein [Armatimonadota bacterium]|nr:HEAT repeat domain-containing protein [Armatimonadota bacterium]
MEPPLRFLPEDIRALAAADDVTGLTRALRFARRRDAIRAAHFALVSLGEKAVEPLVAFMRDDLTERGQRAWWTLMRIGRPAQDPVIECLVSSPIPAARAAATLVLGHVGARSADRHLVRALDDSDDGVKLAATLMLGSRLCSEAVPGLLRILTRGQFDDPYAPHPDQLSLSLPGVEAYGEVLQPEDSGYGDAASQRSTASLESLVVPYERGLADDAEAYLEVMSDAGAAEGFSRDRSRDKVVPVWVSAPWNHWNTDGLRQAAALSLGRIGDSRAVESLARCADDENEPLMLRAYAIDALGVIGDNRGFDVVYDALREEELEDEALYALGRFADMRALVPLARAALSDDSINRICAIGALSSLGDRAALPYLHRLTLDPDTFIVRQALRGLGRLGSQAALETVAAQLTHVDPQVRQEAAAALHWAHRQRAAQKSGSIWDP